MESKEFISPAQFFKRFIGMYLIFGIIIYIVNEFLKVDTFISGLILNLVPEDNNIMTFVAGLSVNFLLSAIVTVSLLWYSTKNVFKDANLESSGVSKVMLYFSILFWILTLPFIILQFSSFGSIQTVFLSTFLKIPQSVVLSASIIVDILSFIVSIFFLRKFLLKGTQEN